MPVGKNSVEPLNSESRRVVIRCGQQSSLDLNKDSVGSIEASNAYIQCGYSSCEVRQQELHRPAGDYGGLLGHAFPPLSEEPAPSWLSPSTA